MLQGNSRKGFGRCRHCCLCATGKIYSLYSVTNSWWDDISRTLFVISPVSYHVFAGGGLENFDKTQVREGVNKQKSLQTFLQKIGVFIIYIYMIAYQNSLKHMILINHIFFFNMIFRSRTGGGLPFFLKIKKMLRMFRNKRIY